MESLVTESPMTEPLVTESLVTKSLVTETLETEFHLTESLPVIKSDQILSQRHFIQLRIQLLWGP